MTENKKININVPVLARVEGEGALAITIENQEITHLKLSIFEPPRLFEKLLEGRHFSEVPDIVARICGICPVAYQMSAVHAFENLFECQTSAWVKAMRRLFYCGEWIESHALHIHLLAAPDFLGYSSAPAMAKDYPMEVKRGIQIQHVGNLIVKFLGGRSVHPVGVKVGGFYHAPSHQEAADLLGKLQEHLSGVKALLPWLSQFSYPDISQNFTSISLSEKSISQPTRYPFISDNIISDKQHNLSIAHYERYFIEHHEPHSTALFSLFEHKPYLVGPLARLNLNHQYLPEEIQTAIAQVGLSFPSKNMYHSMLARAIEVWYAFNESISILEAYEQPDIPYAEVTPKAGVAFGCSEAPRGTLWHRYEVDEKGFIIQAKIVPPTSQNQARIEEDLRQSITHFGLDKPEDDIRFHAEQIVRNYDPCISCATHFLDLRITRR